MESRIVYINHDLTKAEWERQSQLRNIVVEKYSKDSKNTTAIDR